jgi:putative DNA primase/helicase
MPTATAILPVAEPIDELILKLIGVGKETHALVTKHRETLQTIARYDHLDHNTVLQALLDYEQKFGSLPAWDDFQDYVNVRPQNEGLIAELGMIKEIHESGYETAYSGLEILITAVAETVEHMKFAATLRQAEKIAVNGVQDRKTGKVTVGPAAAMGWLSTQLDLGAEDTYKHEEGEIDLLSGRDGAATFTVTAIPASTVKPVAISWLWPQRFPMKMTLIAGKPDNGKSTVALDMVARTTIGADWPDGAKNTLGPRDVLMAGAEDDLNDTVVPRLMAAGADLKRIQFIHHIRTQEFDEKDQKKSEVRRLQLAADIKKLKLAIEANPQIALVVVDTLTSYFGDVNANADREIRPVMDELAKAFNDCRACFLGLIHHNKKSDVDALQKILGASSVAGSVRAAYGCSRDPENKDEFYFAHVKGNVTKKRGGLKYKMGEKTIDGITSPYIEWLGEIEEDANAVMALERESRDQNKKGVDKARLFLPLALEKGPKACGELFAEAQAESISKHQLYRAKDDLGVKSVKRGDSWYWYIPVIEQTFNCDQAIEAIS